MYPLNNATITENFGENKNPSYKTQGLLGHSGVDFVTYLGDSVKAAFPGTVVLTRNQHNIDLTQGREAYVLSVIDGTPYLAGYCHLETITVSPGDCVNAGDEIGKEGNTGDVYYEGLPIDGKQRFEGVGYHLHFQMSPLAQSKAIEPGKQYVPQENGLQYKDADGNYYEYSAWGNGYQACIDPSPFLRPKVTSSMFQVLLSIIKKAIRPKSLVYALEQVESGGDVYAKGDLSIPEHAYGILQIRQPVCDDVNRRFGTNYKAEDMLGNKALSEEVFAKYVSIYLPDGTDEDKARLWNGGMGGVVHKERTNAYWSKVNRYL